MKLCKSLSNRLETVSMSMYPEIKKLKIICCVVVRWSTNEWEWTYCICIRSKGEPSKESI